MADTPNFLRAITLEAVRERLGRLKPWNCGGEDCCQSAVDELRDIVDDLVLLLLNERTIQRANAGEQQPVKTAERSANT